MNLSTQISKTELARVKRFLERFQAEPEFRQATIETPDELAQSVGPLWDSSRLARTPLVEAFLEYRAERENSRAVARRMGKPDHPNFRAWRRRQIERCASELSPGYAAALIHHPATFELAKGCSVGCWFCGISAPKLDQVWSYQKNQVFWAELLGLFKSVLGGAAGQSFCYWATDPFDNPDYEKFCLDFHRILGVFPPTTTALAWRFPKRARKLLELSHKNGQLRNRFSILSLGQLKRVYEEFSEEELLDTDLAIQNKGSLSQKAVAGRAREAGSQAASTIACVSGFLLNMVEGSIKLISPCRASDTWPDGYRIHAKGDFQDIQQLEMQLSRMTGDEFMPIWLPLDKPVRFRSDLQYDGECLKNAQTHFQIKDRNLADKIAEGRHTKMALANLLKDERPLAQTLYTLDSLFERGLLEEPCFAG